jgi:uncharacterized membrane protein required for colicin V production
MYSTTDIISAVCLIFFFYRGWAKGFLRNILGPVSLILSCVLAAIYFRETKNMITSLLIGILGPFALNILFSVLIAVWNKTMDGKKDPSQISRLLGAGVSLLWGGFHLVLILALISLAPGNAGWMKNLKSDVLQSRSYTMVILWIKKLSLEAFPDIGKTAMLLRDPGYSQKLRSLPGYAELMRDQTIRHLLSDEDLMQKLKNCDIKEMVTNPKTRAVFQNPALLKKLMDLNIKMIEQNMEENSDEAVKPRWMEIE